MIREGQLTAGPDVPAPLPMGYTWFTLVFSVVAAGWQVVLWCDPLLHPYKLWTHLLLLPALTSNFILSWLIARRSATRSYRARTEWAREFGFEGDWLPQARNSLAWADGYLGGMKAQRAQVSSLAEAQDRAFQNALAHGVLAESAAEHEALAEGIRSLREQVEQTYELVQEYSRLLDRLLDIHFLVRGTWWLMGLRAGRPGRPYELLRLCYPRKTFETVFSPLLGEYIAELAEAEGSWAVWRVRVVYFIAFAKTAGLARWASLTGVIKFFW